MMGSRTGYVALARSRGRNIGRGPPDRKRTVRDTREGGCRGAGSGSPPGNRGEMSLPMCQQKNRCQTLFAEKTEHDRALHPACPMKSSTAASSNGRCRCAEPSGPPRSQAGAPRRRFQPRRSGAPVGPARRLGAAARSSSTASRRQPSSPPLPQPSARRPRGRPRDPRRSRSGR